ncbi:hypothetical protein TWF694_006435 [Orbilia ellipsospora]|uniref:Uncharacterized protein n=1 Tax=Orbilia ellipsospora TaxID=2528407 RepID=A0AAV9XNI8_9PEZI
MKTTIAITLFAALAAATSVPINPVKCKGGKAAKCPINEFCIGENPRTGAAGVCVPTAYKEYCGGFTSIKCSFKFDKCIEDPRIVCPPNVADCGGSVCIPDIYAKEIGK